MYQGVIGLGRSQNMFLNFNEMDNRENTDLEFIPKLMSQSNLAEPKFSVLLKDKNGLGAIKFGS